MAPVTIEVDQSDTRQSKMDAFFCSTPDDSLSSKSAKKRKIVSSILGNGLTCLMVTPPQSFLS